jgi:carotenoid 1,2-hydratase
MDAFVPQNGYRWIYVDCTSDDTEHTLVVIAMLGNVFSPAYRKARKRAGSEGANPLDFCTMNVALYNKSGQQVWALTETSTVSRSAVHLTIGKSTLALSGNTLLISIDEQAAKGSKVIRGTLEINLGERLDRSFDLNGDGKHTWTPIQPTARCKVFLQSPELNFSGAAYVDSNHGVEALEDGFTRWNWSRATSAEGVSWISYETESKNEKRALHLFHAEGTLERVIAPAAIQRLSKGTYGLVSTGRIDSLESVQTLEDSPFYARSLVTGQIGSHTVTMVHEHVDLDRFAKSWVQFLIPFRMRKGT